MQLYTLYHFLGIIFICQLFSKIYFATSKGKVRNNFVFTLAMQRSRDIAFAVSLLFYFVSAESNYFINNNVLSKCACNQHTLWLAAVSPCLSYR